MRRLLSVLVALSGCGGLGTPGEPPVPRREREEKVVAPPPPQATVNVTVKLAGVPPKAAPSAGPCAQKPPAPGPDGALAGVAVWTDLAAMDPTPGAGAASLEDCALSPPLLVLTPGSAISITNSGKVAREILVSALPLVADAPPFASRSLPPGAVAGVALPRYGRARLGCAGQACEGAVVIAAVGALTDTQGRVALHGVKPGPVTVHAWHPALGEVEGALTVEAGATGELSLSLGATP